jgi:hypothetical protein
MSSRLLDFPRCDCHSQLRRIPAGCGGGRVTGRAQPSSSQEPCASVQYRDFTRISRRLSLLDLDPAIDKRVTDEVCLSC